MTTRMRLGLGPVFAFEWLTTARRWQVYAGRALFVTVLLAGLTVVWIGQAAGRPLSARGQAAVGESFFYAIVGSQLALVLLAAPAATAGALCLDKARGTLAHLLVTDLSDSEIVLGKLAARLVPVLGYVGCALPVLALGTLLGGIDPVALAGSMVLTLGVGILACSLAMFFSVWGSKVHEVLLATYLVLGLWLLAWPMAEGIAYAVWRRSVGEARTYIDVFALAFAPYWSPGGAWLIDQLLFTLALCVLSAGLTVVAVIRMRAVAVRQWGGRKRSSGRAPRAIAGRADRRFGSLPGPSLDGNPVLWREWHRRQPSRWLRTVWGLYLVISLAFDVVAVVADSRRAPTTGSEFAALVCAFQVSVGLLLLTITAPTALNDERIQGSLDVLMATPLPTRSIVLGKWWGGFRVMPLIAFGPVIVASLLCDGNATDVPVPALVLGLILAQGAALTSLGLALSTWIARLGRALALAGTMYLFATIGWVMILLGLERSSETARTVELTMISPFWGTGLLVVSLEQPNFQGDEYVNVVAGAVIWTAVLAAVAALLTWATIATFDRCLGRMPGRASARGRRLRGALKPDPAVSLD